MREINTPRARQEYISHLIRRLGDLGQHQRFRVDSEPLEGDSLDILLAKKQYTATVDAARMTYDLAFITALEDWIEAAEKTYADSQTD